MMATLIGIEGEEFEGEGGQAKGVEVDIIILVWYHKKYFAECFVYSKLKNRFRETNMCDSSKKKRRQGR